MTIESAQPFLTEGHPGHAGASQVAPTLLGNYSVIVDNTCKVQPMWILGRPDNSTYTLEYVRGCSRRFFTLCRSKLTETFEHVRIGETFLVEVDF